MERHVTHNKKFRLRALDEYVRATVIGGDCELSDVKRDGTIFVRFRSTFDVSALESAEIFGRALMISGVAFTQVDDSRIRLPLPE